MCVLWSNPNRKQKGQHREHHFRRRLKIGDEEFRETADAESSERKRFEVDRCQQQRHNGADPRLRLTFQFQQGSIP
jgi:hypothetical protein